MSTHGLRQCLRCLVVELISHQQIRWKLWFFIFWSQTSFHVPGQNHGNYLNVIEVVSRGTTHKTMMGTFLPWYETIFPVVGIDINSYECFDFSYFGHRLLMCIVRGQSQCSYLNMMWVSRRIIWNILAHHAYCDCDHIVFSLYGMSYIRWMFLSFYFWLHYFHFHEKVGSTQHINQHSNMRLPCQVLITPDL